MRQTTYGIPFIEKKVGAPLVGGASLRRYIFEFLGCVLELSAWGAVMAKHGLWYPEAAVPRSRWMQWERENMHPGHHGLLTHVVTVVLVVLLHLDVS